MPTRNVTRLSHCVAQLVACRITTTKIAQSFRICAPVETQIFLVMIKAKDRINRAAPMTTPGTMLPRANFETCLSDYLLNLLISLMLAEGVIDKRNAPDGARAVQIVRTARAYMKSCYGAIATMKEVADACGITVRRLQQAFAEVENRRPHAALAEIRLDAANKSLFKMDPSSTVTEVALNCGFTHLGRFSGAFRQRIGRSPSEVHSGQSNAVGFG